LGGEGREGKRPPHPQPLSPARAGGEGRKIGRSAVLSVEPCLPNLSKVVPLESETKPDFLQQRLLSLDAYRGLIMVTPGPSPASAWPRRPIATSRQDRRAPISGRWSTISSRHVQWAGCGYWDMIQPSFMFMGRRRGGLLVRSPPSVWALRSKAFPARPPALAGPGPPGHFPHLEQ